MNEIVIYTSDTCYRCKFVKQMLDKHNVQYTEVTDAQVAISMGFEQVPVLEVDGKIIEKYSLVLAWLEENGYYSF